MMVRQAVESDHERILSFVLRDPIGWVDEQTYRQYLASGSYGPDRIWLAEDNGRVVACAVWYGARPSDHSLILDCFWVDPDVGDRVALGAAVLQAGHTALQSNPPNIPEYHLFLKTGWRQDLDTCVELEWRRRAAGSAGLTQELERLRYEWTSDTGVKPPGRLLFSAEPEDDVFLDVFRRVAVGSLDQETREGVAHFGAEGQARSTLAFYHGMRGDRAWWRIARTRDGELVGVTIPSANEDFPVIGYLGVVPEQRGHGYAVELLTEATRILAAHGARKIRSDTDTTNVPMATAFERAGYRNFAVRLIVRTAQPRAFPATPADLPQTS